MCRAAVHKKIFIALLHFGHFSLRRNLAEIYRTRHTQTAQVGYFYILQFWSTTVFEHTTLIYTLPPNLFTY